MNKFLATSIFLLFSSLIYSQVDTTKINLANHLPTDSTEIQKHYTISIDKTLLKDKPPVAEHKPISMPDPETLVLINGLKVILIHNNKLPVVSYKLFFDYSPILLQEMKGVDLVFEKMWAKNGRKYNEKYIADYKWRTGTKMKIDAKSIYLEGLSRYKEKNMSIISDLAFRFNFTEDQLENEKIKISDSLYFASNTNEFIVDAVARNLMFGKNNPNGESYDINNIDSLTSKDVKKYYDSFFNPNNAYLVVYGDISMRELQRLVYKYLNRFRKGELIKGYYPQPYNLPQIEIDFIENYNSDDLSVWMGNVMNRVYHDENWLFEKTGDILLFDNKIGAFNDSYLETNNIDNLSYNYKEDGKYFALSYNSNEKDIAKTISKNIATLKKINSNNIIDSLHFDSFKDLILKNYINGMREPEIISDLYLMYYISGFGKYLVPNLSEIIDTISLRTLSESLEKKIISDKLRIVVSGKPKVAVPKLEKLGYKLNYYDQFGNTTFPPALDRAVPDSITVNYVIDRYVKSIGGLEKLKEVKKLLQWWVIDLNNNKLYIKNKYMLPNKRLSTYSNKEIIVLKTVFNGEYGYVQKSGMINDIEGNDFLKLTMERSIFPIIYYDEHGYLLSLESKIPLKGEECYKIRVEAPYGELSHLYFRISDGMLIRKEYIDIKTNKVLNFINFSDFKTFGDIKFPYKTETDIGGKKTTLTLTQIKINDENIRKRDFR